MVLDGRYREASHLRLFHVCKEIIEHGFSLIGFFNLLFDLLELLFKLTISSTLVLLGFWLVDLVEGFKLLSTDIVNNAAEVLF